MSQKKYYKSYYEKNKEKILNYSSIYNQNKYKNMTEDEKKAYIEKVKNNIKKKRIENRNILLEQGIIKKKGRPKKYNL